MLHLTTLKKKEKQMQEITTYVLLVLTLLNLGLVIMVLNRLGGLHRDLRTPVVKKFNPDFKRKPVDIPKESDKKDFRQNRNSQQSLAQNKSKGNSPQNRPQQQIRRPAAKAPDVFSNELPQSAPVSVTPPRPTVSEAPATEGRRPLPPRFAAQEPAPQAYSTPNAQAYSTPSAQTYSASAEPAPAAPASASVIDRDYEDGIELDRSKMTHGRRNMVKKAVIEDDDNTEANA